MRARKSEYVWMQQAEIGEVMYTDKLPGRVHASAAKYHKQVSTEIGWFKGGSEVDPTLEPITRVIMLGERDSS